MADNIDNLGQIIGSGQAEAEEVVEEEFNEFDDFNDYVEQPLEYIGKDIKDDYEEQKKIDFIEGKSSLNMLTLHEKTRLIGIRATQLSKGSLPLVNVRHIVKANTSPNICFDIAEEELRTGVLPLIIKRNVGISNEYWLSNQLIDLNP